MQYIKNRWMMTFLLWLGFLGLASAHNMQMIRCDLSFSGREWTADVWLEGWALYPEDGPLANPGDPTEPGASGQAWMDQLDENAWREMKEIADYYLHDCFKPRLSDELLPFSVAYPDLDKNPVTFLSNKDQNALVQCRISGTLPPDTFGTFSVYWEDYSGTPMALTVRGDEGRPNSDAVAEVFSLKSGGEQQAIYTIDDASETQMNESSGILVGWIKAGFVHILPRGVDHILFILGLFLLQPKLKPLLAQASAFTVAHSITLALVVLGTISVSSRIVESMIALSIAYVGFENLWVKELKLRRVFFVFGLGLLHGMGFASVMQELDIPQGSVLEPLIGFNLGVEFGQVTVLLTAFACTFWAFKKSGFGLFRKIASGAIGIVGLYWTVQRLFG